MSQNSPLPANGTPGINLRGAVDLSALKTRAAAAASGAPAGGSPFAVDVNEQSFQEFVQLSQKVPVVVSLGSGRSHQSAQLNLVLEKLMNDNGGKIALGRVDVDSSPQIAQAFGITAVPTVIALINGQPVPMFEGELPEAQIQEFLTELLKVAASNGVTGSLGGDAAQAPEEPPLPPLHQAARDAIDAGDLALAQASYEKALAEMPADAAAKIGLAQVHLMRRAAEINVVQAEEFRARAAGDQDDLEAALAVADLDVTGGHVEDALARLVAYIGTHFGPERDEVRVRLLELYDVVGVSDPRVSASRQALARALF
ncbi:putative thioredoxin [Arthrobacter stackebrandtii]|uniref:Thioredoxin n=1 Tax=Arthrobacter stackebrandtii TaxID=272161 RepID=A0ABS4Z0Z4_9MICC|nr:tetratricopeptide repeat protein [Arthrobacter stackebrandtii]MBP2413908.1 putative thioredoxin [Arthrobacter stackebrandtii]PYH00474.1 co-chaperone YbbN [Arthrobacter stackebrandtii]